jgi:ubiquinone/menaquinone biosynthesis C-methylase UbiE
MRMLAASVDGPQRDCLLSSYDALAPRFERHRALPDDVAIAIRTTILGVLEQSPRPRLLDLGAGTGRVGRAFVDARDDYVGIDLSLGMLREFRHRAGQDGGPMPWLAQADGQRLPFREATFDAVMLIQVFGGMPDWRRLVDETRRVLRSTGALIMGRSTAPADGVDAQMKQQLASVLGAMGHAADPNPREDVQRWLSSAAQDSTSTVAAAWNAERSPHGFLDRHRTGARFSALPAPVKDEALRKLGAWAAERFGSLDRAVTERHAFELQVFRFGPEVGR